MFVPFHGQRSTILVLTQENKAIRKRQNHGFTSHITNEHIVVSLLGATIAVTKEKSSSF